jgi:hypothetical protein
VTGREAEEVPDDVYQNMQTAIEDLTAALERDPNAEGTLLNRTFAQAMLTIYTGGSSRDYDESLEQWLDGATKLIETHPGNMWGYFLRLQAFFFIRDTAADADRAGQMESQIEQDYEAFRELAGTLLDQFELTDIMPRLFTLSEGPPIVPMQAEVGTIGEISGEVYTSPDGDLQFQMPQLMQPNAITWDEEAAGGDLLVWLQDDISRWYAVQVHPGDPGDTPLAEWMQKNTDLYPGVQEMLEIETVNGPLVITEYRHRQLEASCAQAVLHRDAHFYATEYCLLDHYMGDDDEVGGIRVFAAGYGIEYEPATTVLLSFLQRVEVLGEPILTPPSAIIEGGNSEISIDVDTVNLRVCGDNLVGHIVYVQMWRDAVPGETSNPRTWNYSELAGDNCLEFIDMDGEGSTYAGVTYYTVAALEPIAGYEASQKQDDCYQATGETRICSAASR